MKTRKRLMFATSAIIASALSIGMTIAPATASGITINGSGSTAVKNLLDVCIPDYQKATGNTVNYAGGGSGAGRSAFTSGTVDFAWSDAAYGSSESQPAAFVHVPNVAFPVAIEYQLSGFKGTLNLSKNTLASIFAGKITRWNDPAIVAENNTTIKVPVYKTKKVKFKVKVKGKIKTRTKRVTVKDKKGKPIVLKVRSKVVAGKLPTLPITVWYRSDKSGTTGIVTNWLTKVAPQIWNKPGSAGNQTFTSAFPGDIPAGTFQGANGSDGVSNGIAMKDGSIGYSEVSYATERHLGVVSVENGAGQYVQPTPDGAASFLNDLTAGDKGTVTVNPLTTASGAYPISSFSYGLAYTSGKSAAKQAVVKDFFTYILTTCATNHALAKGYIPVVGKLADIAKAQIAVIK
ncbi:MAG TPA: substrate-binding domain-containing protein [Candidatus Nanopelagicaceae bacterium]|nr:substrate-binding domain-containing protein [Candidatus Nanopelagicaceae bacterium]